MDWQADKNFKHQVGCSLVTLAVFAVLYSSQLQEAIDYRFTTPVQHKIRQIFGQTPKLDKRIKIVSFDDKTTNILGKHDFRLSDWAKLFRNLDKKNPAAVFVDKSWTLPIGKNFDEPPTKEEGQGFVKEILKLKTRLVIAASHLPKKVKRMNRLELDRPPYLLPSIATGLKNKEQISDISWLPLKQGFLPGPPESIIDAFQHVGHINYHSAGFIEPLIRFEKQKIIPHAGLLTVGPPLILDRVLLINSHEVPLTRNGLLPINIPSIEDLRYQEDSLIRMLQTSTRYNDFIQPGDYVVVLPLMYTGNVDFVESPIGSIQGGYVTAAIINSALTGQWLRPLNYGIEIILLAVLISWLMTRPSSVKAVVAATSSTFIVLVSFCVYLFVAEGVMVSWFLPAAAYLTNASAIFGVRTYLMERRSRRLKNALQGAIPPKKLERIISQEEDFKIEPSEKLVTIMFIDLVGFSLVAEELSPQEAFRHLKDQLGMMTRTVHKYNGIVDKNLGDGILCFFGDDQIESGNQDEQANIAIQCAIEIQLNSLDHTLKAESNGAPIFPLRIGINTAPSYVGDIGDRNRIDFTLIGKGVNFASRLEAACEPFKIMLGTETFKMASRFQDYGGTNHRQVQIKHFENLFDAYELNPFFDKPDQYKKALDAFRKYRQISRKHQRHPLIHNSIVAKAGEANGEITNVSISGFGAKFDCFLAKGVNLKIHLEPQEHPQIAKMYELKLLPFTAQVCWGAHIATEETYLHGLLITSLNDSQKQQLFELYAPFISESTEKAG